MLPLQFSTLLPFIITISTVNLRLTFLNINKNNTSPYSMLFSNVSVLLKFPRVRFIIYNIQYLLKFPIAAITKSAL